LEVIIDFLEIENYPQETGRKRWLTACAKRVELGRALALKPKLLLLDERWRG
jgi:ABC-type branched-subunit amino acid transport system ATPase component